MPQLGLFTADPASRVTDLAGLLCGPGQVVRAPGGTAARLSIVLADPANGPALVGECERRGVPAELLPTPLGGTVLRTTFRPELCSLADGWTRGAVKAVPLGFELDGAALRIWLLSAAHGPGQLALDPQAPGTHGALVAAAAAARLPASLHHPRGAGPVLRLAGRQGARGRLLELLGPPPEGAAGTAWPWLREPA